jgi:REP element-mobilizing transposase RayT
VTVTRPLRVQVVNGVYHVTARGNERKAIYRDDTDRQRFLEVVTATLERFGWRCLCYCLMGNHYHLLARTPQPNLCRGMRDLNGIYAQWFNRRHGRDGHLFQGRYRAVLVETDEHLLTAVAYIATNPVRAGLCQSPAQWRWSSHLATLGQHLPGLLALDELLRHFGTTRTLARQHYRNLTEHRQLEGITYNKRVIDGSHDFHRIHLAAHHAASPEIPAAHKRPPPPPLTQLLATTNDADAIATAYQHGYTMPTIAQHLGLHPSTISRRLSRHRAHTNT